MAQLIDRVEAARSALAQKPPAWEAARLLLEEEDAERDLDLAELGLLIEATLWSGRPEETLPLVERAYAANLEAGNVDRAAYYAVDLAHNYYSVRLQRSIGSGWLARAERLLADRAEGPAHGYLALEKGLIAYERNDFDAVLELGKEAERIGREHGDRGLEIRGLQRQGVALVYRGDVAEGNRLLDEAAAAAFGGDLDPYTTLVVYCNVIGTCRDVGAFDRAGEWTERAQQFCDENSTKAFPGICRVNRAEVMRYEGKLAEAEETAMRAFEELRSWAPRIAAAAIYEIGEVRLRLGELSKAEEAFDQADDIGRDPEPGRSLLILARGKPAAAFRSIRRALEDESLGPTTRARFLPPLIEIAAAAGEAEAARTGASELAEIADIYDTPALHAAAALGEGVVRFLDGELDEAVKPFRRALRLWQETSARYEAARTRVWLGRTYRAMDDEDGAVRELEAAGATFDQLGARIDAERVDELLGRHRRRAVERTFVFTDIVDSTKKAIELGETKWQHQLAQHDKLVRELVEVFGGMVVEHTGDGFFLSFAAPREALEAAIAIQQAAERRLPFDVRIGIHATEAGIVTVDGRENYRGAGIHAAARVAALGGAGEIVASAATVGGLGFTASEPRSAELKGLAEPVEVVTIDWRTGA